MTILQDSDGIRWAVSVTSAGLLVTTVTTQLPAQTLYINYSTQSTWLLGITTGGLLTTTASVYVRSNPNKIFLYTPSNVVFSLVVLSNGQLQTTPGFGWVPNGLGATTDNSVAGGAGGFMSIPQMPSPAGSITQPGSGYTNPEWAAQLAPVTFTYFVNGNYFTLTNPGRSA